MSTYVAPQAQAVSTRVASAVPQSSPVIHSSQLPPSVSGAAAATYVHPSAVLSGIHHHPPMQPNRHHPLPDSSWHDHHMRVKGSHVPTSRLPPPPPQPSNLPAHHTNVEKPNNPHSHSLHHSRNDNRKHERLPHTREGAPEPAHSYQHTVNLVAPPHPGSRLTAPTHHTSYVYPVHQLVAPVAHVPIGAAHYAHLPPSIWSPPHPQYHQHAHPQTHQFPSAHHVSPAVVSHAHGQVPYAASHVHHVGAPTPPPGHAYAFTAPHTATMPHPPHPAPTGPPHAVHASPHHPQQHITYAYAHVPAAPPTHHAIKTAVAVSPSQPMAMSASMPYTVSPPRVPHAMEGTVVSAPLPCKFEPVHAHASRSEQLPSGKPNGLLLAGRAKPYQMNGNAPEAVPVSTGTDDRTDTSSPRLSKSHTLPGDAVQPYRKSQDQRKGSNQKERAQLTPGQPMRKPRKPYTIKKSREVWTPEEHSRFLQALQLYDRDWKKIESYIGTKTVLQIRSHAQKHFGKVTKYKTGEYIPPPRPKKRAVLPYPRSRSVGQNKSFSTNENASDNATGGENDAHSGSDANTKSRTGTTKHGQDGSPTLNATDNGENTQRTAAEGREPHSTRHLTRLPRLTEMDPSERFPGSRPYCDKYSSTSNDPQNVIRTEHSAQRSKRPQANSLLRWHPTTPKSKEVVGGEVQDVPRRGSGSVNMKPGMAACPSEPCARRPRSSSYNEDLGQREIRSIRDYRQGPSEVVVCCENESAKQRVTQHSPQRLSSNQVVARDASTSNEASRRHIAIPNNSLLVLSNCVDLMSRDTPPERQPATGWATAAAARRAHRAKIIRGRKPPLPQPPVSSQGGDLARVGKESPRCEVVDTDTLEEKSSRDRRDQDTALKRSLPRAGSQSPAVDSPAEYGCEQPPLDPQRSSAGSRTGSDDAIAGFSSSDHPSVSGSGGESGTGGSLGTSDAGDTEEDPKSSNDGSGDDGNRRGPPTRDSSPTDPNSSGSRENSPNECPTVQPSDVDNRAPLDSGLNKPSETEGRNVAPCQVMVHEGKRNVDCKNRSTGTGLGNGDPADGHYGRHLEPHDKLLANGDDHKRHVVPRTVLSTSHEVQVSLDMKSPQVDRGSQVHKRIVPNLSLGKRQRLRPNKEYGIRSRTDAENAEEGQDPEPQRQRLRQSVKEANFTTNQLYRGRDSAERDR